jgi:hypothetical protein
MLELINKEAKNYNIVYEINKYEEIRQCKIVNIYI